MKFYVTEDEKRLIDEKMIQLPTRRYGAYLRKMAQLPTRRYGAYLRKMAIDGYTRIIPMWASLAAGTQAENC